MISQETGLRGSAQNYGGHDKKKASHAGKKNPFGREYAELKITALKRRDGCSMTGCMTDCNYACPFHLTIRMRIRGSKTHGWTSGWEGEREYSSFMEVNSEGS